MSTRESGIGDRRSPWVRRNAAELRVRDLIGGDERLNVFASAWRASAHEAIVLITARNAEARIAAQSLLGSLVDADWSQGWRQLDLGDALIELHPERALAA